MTATLPMIFAMFLLAQPGPVAAAPQQTAEREQLAAIEAASHQSWHLGDTDALARLMAPEFHFVVMNGAVETRAEILGEGPDSAGRTPSPLQVRSLRAEPDRVVIRGTTGAVISTLHLDATVRGRPLPPQMRVLSVFVREDGAWKLLARSITPLLRPGVQQ